MVIKLLLTLLLFTPTLRAKERIITLSPSVNEIVYALGMGKSVVGNTKYCYYPEASQSVSKVGGYFSPSLEKIISLDPTLVIMQNNNHKLNSQLKQLHIKTKMVKIDRLKNIKSSILELGEVFNKKERAMIIVDKINSSLKALKNIVLNKKILIVFGENSTLSKNIFVAGQNLYFDEIIEASDNTNALQSQRKGQPILNMENIISTNPDIVILLAHAMREKGLREKDLIAPWLKLPINASKNATIYVEEKRYAGIPSDRLILFLKDFKEILLDYQKRSLFN